MKKTDLPLLIALSLTAITGAQADDSLTPTTDYSSEFNYYGADQPFAHEHCAAGFLHLDGPWEFHPDCQPA